MADSAAHLDEIIQAQRVVPRREFFLAVEQLAEPGLTIGDAGFTWIDDRLAEIGYFLEPAYWGRYGTEAARMVLDVARDLGATSAVATTSVANAASQAVMRSVGMVPEPDAPDGRVHCRIALV